MSIVEEAPGYLQVFADGSVKRSAPETVSASDESHNKFKSKDVVIDPSKPITARIFLPHHSLLSSTPLPLVVYFHGGGFCIGSTTWLGYHHFLGDLSVASQSVIVSVDYRLAPENRLPIPYEDCYTSLEWILSSYQAKSEPWLDRADLSRVFLSGDSAGGNIAHHVVMKVVSNGSDHVKIKGLLLIHPYFGSEKRTEKEMEEGAATDVAMNDMFWRLSIPEGLNRDYFGCDFEKAGLSAARWTEFPAAVVYVAGMDFLKEKGVMYAQFLQMKRVEVVKLVEAKRESHVFHVFYPESEATRLLQRQMSEFINSY